MCKGVSFSPYIICLSCCCCCCCCCCRLINHLQKLSEAATKKEYQLFGFCWRFCQMFSSQKSSTGCLLKNWNPMDQTDEKQQAELEFWSQNQYKITNQLELKVMIIWNEVAIHFDAASQKKMAPISVFHPSNGCHIPVGGLDRFPTEKPQLLQSSLHLGPTQQKNSRCQQLPDNLLQKKKVLLWFWILRCFFHLVAEFLNHRCVFFPRYEFYIEFLAFNFTATLGIRPSNWRHGHPILRCQKMGWSDSPGDHWQWEMHQDHFGKFLPIFWSHSNAWNELGCKENRNNLF